MISPTAAYIHIPFCRRRCYYCDFPVAIVGDKPPLGDGSRINGSNSGTIAHYVGVLCQEIQQTKGWGSALKTVFFGGGTPSLLAAEQVDRILATLDRQFGIASDAEISMEIDPGTFDLDQIQGFYAAGVNRVSLGVQAFQPELLKLCGRSHSVDDIYCAVDQLRQVGFRNLSLDLISGLPTQTLEHWEDSLTRAIALSPTHISCYDLIVESGTPFSRQYKPGETPLPSDTATADMYRIAQQLLTRADFQHYEICNYAKPGFQSRHNRVYWQNLPFYGFGMGATSSVGGDRVARPRKTWEYYDWVMAMDTVNSKSCTPPTNLPDQLLETLMLGLRLAEGIDWATLAAQFGNETMQEVWQCLQPYQQQGWVEMINPSQDCKRFRLTDPEGFLFSNVVLTALFEHFDQ
jgi:putative oxygen-independent coproporphyrinogen III oxidase